MLDLTSTRATTDHQSAAYCRLLAAIVVQAVRDAAKPLTSEEKNQRMNIYSEAIDAIRWLFGKDTNFEPYSKLIGFDAGGFRKALLAPTADAVEESKYFTQTQRRIIRIRHAYYMESYELSR